MIGIPEYKLYRSIEERVEMAICYLEKKRRFHPPATFYLNFKHYRTFEQNRGARFNGVTLGGVQIVTRKERELRKEKWYVPRY